MAMLGRKIGAIAGAVLKRGHYIAAANMLRYYQEPIDAFRRYLLGTGNYPTTVTLRTPSGAVALTLYCNHDIMTVNEVFCRHDYPAGSNDRIVVDFGSNIGISAAYFLTRNPDAFVYCHEPLPQNVLRLKYNLSRFPGRYSLFEGAVGPAEGRVTFGYEDTGRYGGIGLAMPHSLDVACVDANDVLDRIVSNHGVIDILKIDIESLEREIVERIPLSIATRIRRIYVEFNFGKRVPLTSTHVHRQCGAVAHFSRH